MTTPMTPTTYTFTTPLAPLDDVTVTVQITVDGLTPDDATHVGGTYREHDVLTSPVSHLATSGDLSKDLTFPSGVLAQRVLAQAQKAITARLDTLRVDLLAALVVAGLADADPEQDPEAKNPAITVGPYQIRVTTPRGPSRIDRGRLVELGVDPDVITQATVPGAWRSQVDIRPIPMSASTPEPREET